MCFLHLANIASDLVYIKTVPKYNSSIQDYLWTFMYPSFILRGIFTMYALLIYTKEKNSGIFWVILNGIPLYKLSKGVDDIRVLSKNSMISCVWFTLSELPQFCLQMANNMLIGLVMTNIQMISPLISF